MTRRNHSDIPALRAGCFPKEALPNPPHDITRCGDNLMLCIVPADAYDALPAITVPEGQTRVASQEPLMEAVTTNGWRCYLALSDTESLLTLLNLAAAGRLGVQTWMKGESYAEAYSTAERIREEEHRRREAARRQNPSSAPDLPDLDDIEI